MPIMNTKTTLLFFMLLLLAVPAIAVVPPGRITVYSSPPAARACVDNRICDITPSTFAVEGNAWHMVVVTEKGYQDWTQMLYVTSDQTSRVDAYMDLNPNVTAIHVTVSPGGGTVCLDNGQCRPNLGTASTNGTTQYTGVSPGYHTISVESPAGYQDTQELVQVKLGEITVISIALEPFIVPTTSTTRATGMVRVYVDRTGSTVCLDNARCAENVGGSPGPGTATTVFEDVTADEVHIVTVAANGFRPFSYKVLVEKDEIATVDVSLLPLDRMTTVTATTAMPTATTVPATTILVTMVPTAMPPTTKGGLDAVLVIGALALCGAVFLLRKDRQ